MQVFNLLIYSGKRYLTGMSKCVKKGGDGQSAVSPRGEGKKEVKNINLD